MTPPPEPTACHANGAASPVATHRFAHEAMACTFELHLAEADHAYAEQAAGAAFVELDRIELELSRFVPHSDVARIAGLAAGESLVLGAEASDCLALAAEICVATGGAFNIAYSGKTLPLMFDPAMRSVTVTGTGVTVDLGGIGKGYALDRVAELLRDWSIPAALMHAGCSTALALEPPPGKRAWAVALRDPSGDPDLAAIALPATGLCNEALSGSGRSLHGAHIIDPRTGESTAHALAAWARARCAARADALSTAFMVLSPDQVQEYCERHPDVSAALALLDGGKVKLVSFGKGIGHVE